MRYLMPLLLALLLPLAIWAEEPGAEDAKSVKPKAVKIDVKGKVNPWEAELEDPKTVDVHPGAVRLTKANRSEGIYSKTDSAHVWVSAGASWEVEAGIDSLVTFHKRGLLENSWEIVSVITFSGTARLEALRADDRAIVIEIESRGEASSLVSVTVGSPTLVVKTPEEKAKAEEAEETAEGTNEEKDVRTHEIIIW